MRLPRIYYVLASLAGAVVLMILLAMIAEHNPTNLRVVRAQLQTVLFVAPQGAGSLCSQSEPCSLETAVTTAVEGESLYLAHGTYTSQNQVVLNLDKSINLLGGWNGAPTGTITIDPETYPTIFDAQGARRGIQIDGEYSVILDGFTIQNGVHIQGGAGLYARNAQLTLQHMRFLTNSVETSAASNPMGGGVLVQGGGVMVKDSEFLANSVLSPGFPRGGGMAITGTFTATVDGCTFQSNDAWVASGLFFQGPLNRTALVVRDSRFLDNGIYYSGSGAYGAYSGALEVRHAHAQITGNEFNYNYAVSNYGALSVHYSDLLLENNVFLNNISFYNPGIFLKEVDPFQLINNIIADNKTETSDTAAVVISSGSKGTMLHTTIANNQKTNGVNVNYGSAVSMTNTILLSQTIGVRVDIGGSASLEATLWGSGAWANNIDWSGGGEIMTGTTNLWALPGFVNPTEDDYHLAAGSPAIDQGVVVDVVTDIDGQMRPSGSGFDLGADEYWPHYPLYLPIVLSKPQAVIFWP
jgi:hypothetical protein